MAGEGSRTVGIRVYYSKVNAAMATRVGSRAPTSNSPAPMPTQFMAGGTAKADAVCTNINIAGAAFMARQTSESVPSMMVIPKLSLREEWKYKLDLCNSSASADADMKS